MDETRKILSQSLVATVVVVVGLGAAVGYYYWQGRAPAAAPAASAPPPAPAPAPAAKSESPWQFPIDEAASDHETTLDQSDAKILEALAHVSGWRAGMLRLLLPADLVRHIVATVDALPREKVAVAVIPTEPVPGLFQVDNSLKGLAIGSANAKRYAPYVQALTALDPAQLVSLYRRFYPLFQQAYRDLGYPKGYFNDRLVEVIDNLLEAPEPAPPVAVVAPTAMYKYFDADLEALPAGQKVLVRVGPANEKLIKARLREIRALVTVP